jgi:hypothetical protein
MASCRASAMRGSRWGKGTRFSGKVAIAPRVQSQSPAVRARPKSGSTTRPPKDAGRQAASARAAAWAREQRARRCHRPASRGGRIRGGGDSPSLTECSSRSMSNCQAQVSFLGSTPICANTHPGQKRVHTPQARESTAAARSNGRRIRRRKSGVVRFTAAYRRGSAGGGARTLTGVSPHRIFVPL